MEHWPTTPFLLLLLFLVAFAYVAYALYVRQSRRSEQRVRLFHADQIDNPEAVQEFLKVLVREKVRLRIRLNNRHKSYMSSLLAIDPQALLIDELFPLEGNELIRESTSVEVDFFLATIEKQRLHISYGFTSRYLATEQWKGFPALRIAFPERIIRNQKRKYLRISPPVTEPLFITFTLQGQTFTEKIANISAGGARFYTNLGKSMLAPGTRLATIHVEIPATGTITCPAIVRLLYPNEQPVIVEGKQMFNSCGIEFENIEDGLREKIIKYVIATERQALKRLSREFD